MMSLGTYSSLSQAKDQTHQRIAYLEEVNRALMESLERIEALFDFVGRNDLTNETEQVFDALVSEARNLLEVKGSALALVNPSDHKFVICRVMPKKKKAWAAREIAAQIECGIFSWVLKTLRPSIVPNLTDPDKLMTVLIPLATSRRVIGMLMLWSPIQEKEVTPHLLKMLAFTARHESLALENSQLYRVVEQERETSRKNEKNLRARQKRINHEIDVAKIIQSNLLPRNFPTNWFCRFAARYVPAGEVGGDFYDVLTLRDGSVGVVIADVAGHGVPSTFGTAALKVLLRRWARRPRDLVATVFQLNQELKDIFEEHQYLTLFLGRIFPKPLHLEYVLAGHPPPILFNGRNRKLRALRHSGFLVGFDPDILYRKRSITLHPGDRLLCYTDGMIEVRNPKKQVYRLLRLRESVSTHSVAPLDELPDLLLKDIDQFRCNKPFEDDLSILIVEVFPHKNNENNGI